MIKKTIPGFGRYHMLENGIIRRTATGTIISPDKSDQSKIYLIDDAGKKATYNVIEGHKELYPNVKKKKQVTQKFITPLDVSERLKLKRPHKLTEAEVIEMRNEFAAGNFKPKHGPARYGICAQTAGKIIHRILYPNL